MKRRLLAIGLGIVIAVLRAAAPAGTEVSLRLDIPVSTATAHAGDRIQARVIAPVAIDGRIAIRTGTIISGSVSKVSASGAEPAELGIVFDSLEWHGARRSLAARIVEVDNARETVDDAGLIHGIRPTDTMASRLDAGIERAGQEYPMLGGILNGVRHAMAPESSLDIIYPAGVELTIRLSQPVDAPGAGALVEAGLERLQGIDAVIAGQPMRTESERSHTPSDPINLVMVGDESALRKAFAKAGWSEASGLNAGSALETALAAAEDRGFREAPVSSLRLGSQPPDLVFEKSNDTVAMRHHVRIWRRAVRFHGKTVWLAAATHDIAVAITEDGLVHRVDRAIDRERAKVMNDLGFTGAVRAAAVIIRSDAPKSVRTATGDELITDGGVGWIWVR